MTLFYTVVLYIRLIESTVNIQLRFCSSSQYYVRWDKNHVFPFRQPSATNHIIMAWKSIQAGSLCISVRNKIVALNLNYSHCSGKCFLCSKPSNHFTLSPDCCHFQTTQVVNFRGTTPLYSILRVVHSSFYLHAVIAPCLKAGGSLWGTAQLLRGGGLCSGTIGANQWLHWMLGCHWKQPDVREKMTGGCYVSTFWDASLLFICRWPRSSRLAGTCL